MKTRPAGAARTRSWVIAAGALSVALVMALAGCALGPEPERPETAVDDLETFVHRQAAAPLVEDEASVSASDWWRRIGDPEIVDLVEQALSANTDLHAAAARVIEAEAQLRKAGGARWPEVSAGLSASRVKNSFVLPTLGRVSVYSTSYSEDLSVSYLVDLFGRLKRTRQSAWASLLATEAARQAMQHAVVAQVVQSRVAIASLEQSMEVARQTRESWEKTLATVERRYRGGLVAAVDLYLARENLSATQATEAALEGRLWAARHALDQLVGRRPGTGEPISASLPPLPDPQALPPGLPAALLEQRPDLRRAEMELRAATYGIGVALADLFPSLALSGSAGTVADSLTDLASSEGVVYNAVASLVGPIFSGGRRRAEVVAARARAEQAAALYAGVVLTALREVEDALIAESTGRRRLEHSRRRLDEARAADRLARERYQRGVENLLKVLETERRLRAAEESLIATRADLWNARVDLHLALGGDWELEASLNEQSEEDDGGRGDAPLEVSK